MKEKKNVSRFDLRVQAATACHTRRMMGIAARNGAHNVSFRKSSAEILCQPICKDSLSSPLTHSRVLRLLGRKTKKSMHYVCWMHPRSYADIFKVAKAIVKWSHFLSLRFLIFLFFSLKWTAFELDTLQKRGDKYIKLWLILSSQKAVCIGCATSLLHISLCASEVTRSWIFFFLLFFWTRWQKRASPCVATVCLGGDDDVTERTPASQKGTQEATDAGITGSCWM